MLLSLCESLMVERISLPCRLYTLLACHCGLTVLFYQPAVPPSGPTAPPNQELPSVDGPLFAQSVTPIEESPYVSTGTAPQSKSYIAPCAADESAEPEEWGCSARLHCELNNQTSEQPTDSTPSAPPSAPALSPQHKSRLGSDGEEIPPSETARTHIPTSESDRQRAIEGDGPTGSPAGRPLFEPSAAGCASAASVTHGVEVAAEPGECVAEFSADSPGSALHHEGAAAALSSDVAEGGASPGADGRAPATPEPTGLPAERPGVAEASQNTALRPGPAREATPVPTQVPPEMLSEDLPNWSSLDGELQPERHAGANLMLCAVFLSGIVSLSVVFQEPSALFFIGVLLVMRRL